MLLLLAAKHAAGHVRWISDSGAFEVSRVDAAVKCFTVVTGGEGNRFTSARMLSPKRRARESRPSHSLLCLTLNPPSRGHSRDQIKDARRLRPVSPTRHKDDPRSTRRGSRN